MVSSTWTSWPDTSLVCFAINCATDDRSRLLALHPNVGHRRRAGHAGAAAAPLIFYRSVRGRVVHRDQRCNRTPPATGEERLFMIDCDDRVEVGPRYLSIDNSRFLLAPEEWRDYCAGEEVEVMAADLEHRDER